MRMDDSRRRKKCRMEEIRGIINGDTTKWEIIKRIYGRGERRGNINNHKEWGLRRMGKKNSQRDTDKDKPRNPRRLE